VRIVIGYLVPQEMRSLARLTNPGHPGRVITPSGVVRRSRRLVTMPIWTSRHSLTAGATRTAGYERIAGT